MIRERIESSFKRNCDKTKAVVEWDDSKSMQTFLFGTSSLHKTISINYFNNTNPLNLLMASKHLVPLTKSTNTYLKQKAKLKLYALTSDVIKWNTHRVPWGTKPQSRSLTQEHSLWRQSRVGLGRWPNLQNRRVGAWHCCRQLIRDQTS